MELCRHIQQFLARTFRGSVPRTRSPRLLTMTRAADLPGGGSSGGGGGSGSGGVPILSGDVTGQAQNTQVAQLQAVTLTLTSIATGDVLTYNGTAIVNSKTVGGALTITGALTASAAGNSLGATTLTGDLTLSTHNLVTDTSTGTQIGTGATQKLGFWGHAPAARPAAYTVTNPTTNRSLDEAAATLAQVAQVLGTLLQDLQSIGIIG